MREVDDVAAAAIALCAARLDARVSAEEFVELVDNLIQVSRADCAADGPAESDGRPQSSQPATAKASRGPVDAPTGRPSRLSFDDRTRLKQQYKQACDGRQRAPRGWVDQKAAEFGVSVSTIKGAIYGTDGA